MKRNKLFKCILSFLVLVTALNALNVVSAFPANSIKVNAAKSYGVDFSSGVIKYALSDRLYESPNTFEAIIKIDKNAEGEAGNIFSNELKSKTPMLSYSVNSYGNLHVNWNSYEKNFDFDKVDLRTGKYEHIAVVRYTDRGVFALYVNGSLKQEVACGTGSELNKIQKQHAIGGDWFNNAEKRPFKGFIKQVTLYSSALTAPEVKNDYDFAGDISYKTRSNLMFNVYLALGKTVLKDTSMYRNNAYMATNDLYFEGDLFETQDYTLAVLPDLQMLTNHYQSTLHCSFDYLINNKQSKKIEFAISTGDITDGYTNGRNWERQYPLVASQFERLKAEANLPYAAIPGNHDYDNECRQDHSVTEFNKVFQPEKYTVWDEWGGSYSPDSIVNAYYLVTMGGVDYIIFALDFGPSDDVLDWCCQITERYPDRRLIVTTHGFLNPDGYFIATGTEAPTDYGWNGKTSVNNPDRMWEKWLKKYSNVFMVISGHVFVDDIVQREFVGDNGNVVSCFLINQQSIIMNDGLDGLLGMFTFDEKNMLCYVNYVSSVTDKMYNYQNQFVWDFKDNTSILSKTYYPDGVVSGTMKTSSREHILNAFVYGIKLAPSASTNEGKTVVMLFAAIAVIVSAAICLVVTNKLKKDNTEAQK